MKKAPLGRFKSLIAMVGREGFEPSTKRLKVRPSLLTNQLLAPRYFMEDCLSSSRISSWSRAILRRPTTQNASGRIRPSSLSALASARRDCVCRLTSTALQSTEPDQQVRPMRQRYDSATHFDHSNHRTCEPSVRAGHMWTIR